METETTTMLVAVNSHAEVPTPASAWHALVARILSPAPQSDENGGLK